MWKAKSWPGFTSWCIFSLIYLSSSVSSFEELAWEKDSIKISEESLRSNLNVSTGSRIDEIRYFLSPKTPGESIAIVVDTAEPFYETIGRLWKALFATGDGIRANILLFSYNDTDCSLVGKLESGDVAVSESLDRIPATKATSGSAEMIFECLNFALNMIRPGSSVTVFTGRRAGDGPTLGESTAQGMIGKRCKLNGIWCNGDAANDYEETVKKTNGAFLRFLGLHHQDGGNVNSQRSKGSLASNLRTASSDRTWNTGSEMTAEKSSRLNFPSPFEGDNQEDESADLILYDPKISGESGRIFPSDGENESREAMKLEDMKPASITAIESALRLEDTSIEIAAETSLIGRPGTVSRLTFRITNNYPLTIRHYFQAKSTSFSIVYLQPRNAWIEAGQTVNVVADILVPTTATDSTTETLTLTVQGIGSVEKSAYIYVRQTGSTISDTNKPSVTYSFNGNCAEKLGSSVCANSIWSVDVTVQDSDSGLQRVTSSPKGIRMTNNFVSGIKSSMSFQYAATCCQTSVVVTAEDLLGNSNSLTIDVNVWYNLTWGQIAAIILGVLLFILLLIAIILAIIFFIRKRKESQDLPFTQRYGTRPKRAERTSF